MWTWSDHSVVLVLVVIAFDMADIVVDFVVVALIVSVQIVSVLIMSIMVAMTVQITINCVQITIN